MCVYNGDDPDHFKLAIESIFNQSLLPDQLVLVVDGPVDPTISNIISTFQTQQPVFDVHKIPNNVGLIKALNHGLRQCEHQLVIRMDADDIAMPDRIRRQKEFMETHPEITVLGSQMTEFAEDINDPLPSKVMPLTHEAISTTLPWRNPINHPTVCYRRDAILDIGGYPELEFLEDYHLWSMLINKGYRCHNLDVSLLFYRFSDSTLMRRSGTKNFINEIKLRRWLFNNHLCSAPVFVLTGAMQLILRFAPIFLKRYLWRRSRKQP